MVTCQFTLWSAVACVKSTTYPYRFSVKDTPLICALKPNGTSSSEINSWCFSVIFRMHCQMLASSLSVGTPPRKPQTSLNVGSYSPSKRG